MVSNYLSTLSNGWCALSKCEGKQSMMNEKRECNEDELKVIADKLGVGWREGKKQASPTDQ